MTKSSYCSIAPQAAAQFRSLPVTQPPISSRASKARFVAAAHLMRLGQTFVAATVPGANGLTCGCSGSCGRGRVPSRKVRSCFSVGLPRSMSRAGFLCGTELSQVECEPSFRRGDGCDRGDHEEDLSNLHR